MTENSDSIAELIEALKDENWRTQRSAAKTLAKMGPAAAPAVPQLIEALKAEHTSLRWAVANALGEIGADAKDAIPVLQEIAHDWLSRPACQKALHKIDPDRFSEPR